MLPPDVFCDFVFVYVKASNLDWKSVKVGVCIAVYDKLEF